MKYRIKTLDAAYIDLKEIKLYLAQFSPGTVKKFVDLYKKQRSALHDFPYSNQAYDDDTDYRRFVVGDYLGF